MVGYGPEENHFVAELTYNYGVGNYCLGNDFQVGLASLRNPDFWTATSSFVIFWQYKPRCVALIIILILIIITDFRG